MEFVNNFQKVIKEPTKFFKELIKRKTIGEAYVFYVYVMLILGVFISLYYLVFFATSTTIIQDLNMPVWVLFLLMYVLTVILSAIGIFVSAGILHLFFMALKGKGKFKDTFNMMIYSSVPNFLSSPVVLVLSMASLYFLATLNFVPLMITEVLQWIILVGMLIWIIMVQLNAFSLAHKVTKIRVATALYFIPIGLVIIAIVLLVIFGFASA